MSQLMKMFSQKEVLMYLRNRKAPQFLGASLFPQRKIQGFEFDILRAGDQTPVIASFHALDTESEIGSRSTEKQAQELALVKRKMQIREKDLYELLNPRTPQEGAYLRENVYNDVERLANSIYARFEATRMQVLSSGLVTLTGPGLSSITVDYLVPDENKHTLDLTDPAVDVITTLYNWASNLAVTPTRILTSTRVRNTILTHDSIKSYFDKMGAMVTPDSLNNLLSTFGLPAIRVYDEKYYSEQANGTKVQERYFPENKMAMFGDGTLGETVYGSTPGQLRLAPTIAQTAMNDLIFAEIYESSIDPVGSFTRAEGMAMPSLADPNALMQIEFTLPSVTP